MSEPVKIRYEIALDVPIAATESAEVLVRSIAPNDRAALARVMLDAYVGTIDYEGETITEAIEAVDDWLGDSSTRLRSSVCVEVDGEIVAAALLSDWQGAPFIGYVMTSAANKRKGYGRLVAQHAINRLVAEGLSRVVLYITSGNTASERLFASLGAKAVPDVVG